MSRVVKAFEDALRAQRSIENIDTGFPYPGRQKSANDPEDEEPEWLERLGNTSDVRRSADDLVSVLEKDPDEELGDLIAAAQAIADNLDDSVEKESDFNANTKEALKAAAKLKELLRAAKPVLRENDLPDSIKVVAEALSDLRTLTKEISELQAPSRLNNRTAERVATKSAKELTAASMSWKDVNELSKQYGGSLDRSYRSRAPAAQDTRWTFKEDGFGPGYSEFVRDLKHSHMNFKADNDTLSVVVWF